MDQEFGVSTLVEEEFEQRRQVKLQHPETFWWTLALMWLSQGWVASGF